MFLHPTVVQFPAAFGVNAFADNPAAADIPAVVGVPAFAFAQVPAAAGIPACAVNSAVANVPAAVSIFAYAGISAVAFNVSNVSSVAAYQLCLAL